MPSNAKMFILRLLLQSRIGLHGLVGEDQPFETHATERLYRFTSSWRNASNDALERAKGDNDEACRVIVEEVRPLHGREIADHSDYGTEREPDPLVDGVFFHCQENPL